MPLCPSCSSDNPADARFCRSCGKSMTAAPATSDVPPSAAAGRSNSTNAVLVIGLVVALVGLAGAAGYYFLAGPGQRQASSDVPGPQAPLPTVTQPPPTTPLAAQPSPLPAPPAAITAPTNDVPPPPPTTTDNVPVPPPAVALPAVKPPAKPKRRDPDESAFFPDNGPAGRLPPPVATDPYGGRWEKMRNDLYRCGYDAYCQERVKQRYCPGYWGRVAECVPPAAYPQPGYPPPPRGYPPY